MIIKYSNPVNSIFDLAFNALSGIDENDWWMNQPSILRHVPRAARVARLDD